MKTTLVLIIAAVAGVSFAGPSEGASFAIRNAREYAARTEAANNRVALVRGAESNQCGCSAQATPARAQQTYLGRGQLSR